MTAKSLVNSLQQARHRITRSLTGDMRIRRDESLRRFVRFNEEKWARRYVPKKDQTILVGLFAYNPSIYCYSYVINYLAEKTRSQIETFSFADEISVVTEKVYASFGARPGMTMARARKFEKEAHAKADAIFAGLETKWDVLQIAVDGVLLGDLIYDTYLRHLVKATVDVRDLKLRDYIRAALLIYLECRDYFAKKKVVALFADHTVYINCGIPVRLASLAKIPVFMVEFKRGFFVLRLDPELPEGNQSNYRRWPYHKYNDLFAKLPAEEQERGRREAGAALQQRLMGKVDDRVLQGITAFGAGTGKRIFDEGDEPRVLVLLNDFCDNVHKFRNMLFADYYEWAHALFEQASRTPFTWYAKPHPNNVLAQQKNELNNAVLAELKTKYPKIKLLDPSVSNRQMVEEGVSAVFTAHGTAGHEFAYLGVPVVNAGDNLHIAFGFNLNPKTIEEFNRCVATAGDPGFQIDKSEVEAFFYMQHFYFMESAKADVSPIDAELINSENFLKRASKSAVYDPLIESASPERDAKLRAYFERYFSAHYHFQPDGTAIPIAV